RPERIRASLVPAEGDHAEIWPGMAKTHRLLVHVHGPEEPLEALSFRSLQYQLPDEPTIPAEVYAQAKVWPDVFPAGRSEAIEWLLSRRADERCHALGMLDFGDGPDWGYTGQRRGGDHLVWTNNEYDFTHAMYLHWARTGERRFKGAADVSGQHWMDVDICHASDDPLRVGGHVTHSAFHVSGGLAPSHQWVTGLLDYYHHSGLEEALEAALGVGENVLKLLAQERFQQPGGVQVRELGWALVAFAALYQETRDERYLAESARLVEVFVRWRDELGGLIAPYTSHTLVRVPFMISVAARGLLAYHALRPDPRIPPLVVSEVDAMLEECLGPEGVFWYKGMPSLHRPHANPLLLGLLAAAYKLTGKTHYLEVALTQLRWIMSSGSTGPSTGGRSQSGAFLKNGGAPGPKAFAQSFLPTMELYVAAAEAGMLP
ncbi:MAG TPA: beta-L-arabinofuranosidase domain-containing protein, partial [Chloroflexota bacterium]|nr:beta-L-arabinofuranosidase domain-containing protein [Chloroflexota bacterium]